MPSSLNARVLFVTNAPNNGRNAGGLLFDRLARAIGVENCTFLSLETRLPVNDLPRYYDSRPYLQISSRNDSKVVRKLLRRIPQLEGALVRRNVRNSMSEVRDFCRSGHYDAVFSCLRGDSLLYLGAILDTSSAPLIAMVEDTVEREIGDDRRLYSMKQRAYYKYLKQAKGVFAAGENMQDYFLEDFGVKADILRLPFEPRPQTSKSRGGKIVVAFAGSFYAKQEMERFVKAVDLCSQTARISEVEFVVASSSKLRIRTKNTKVVELGWLGEGDLQSLLDTAHVAYLPYPFLPELKHSMTMAFPNKIGLYLSHGLPVFFHGPEYSSPKRFIEENRVGTWCHSMRPSDIGLAFDRLVQGDLDQLEAKCLQACQTHFSNQSFDERARRLFSRVIRQSS